MRISTYIFFIFIAVLFTACSSKTVVESDLGISGAPEWVNEGTQYLNSNNGRLFHGVGQAAEMGDASLQLSTADNRARAEVARILTSYLDVINSDYTAASGSGENTHNQQSVSQHIRNLSKVNLTGVKIIGHWKDEKTAIVYAIAELDLDNVKQTAADVDNMNSDLKRYINTHSDNVFDSISKETK